MNILRNMKKSLLLVVCVLMCTVLFAGCAENGKKASSTSKDATADQQATDTQNTEGTTDNADNDKEGAEGEETGAQPEKVEVKDHYLIQIDIADYGTIKVDLDRTAAPITVDNFVNLVNQGFYDGTTFHRIINGFMMQGGDPTGTGYGGLEQTIKGEFKNNGIDNPLKHTRGAISMARSKDPDSASCQFFIMHQDAPHLDGDYACFGYVTEGMEVVDEICENTKVEDRNGSVAPANQPKITKITLIVE